MTAVHGTQPAAGEGFWSEDATDVHGIERALQDLRKQYASAEAAEEGHAGTRNSVANLVIYAGPAENGADAETATATLTQLATRHPSRTILLVADLSPGDPEVKASVSATCSIIAGGKRVCYEEIRLIARGRSGPHLRSIIDPLLVADLPTFLWWTGDPPFRDEVFLTLAGRSERLLIDSGAFRQPLPSLVKLSRFIEDEFSRAIVGDLNWDRLDAWRELLAQLFDPPAARAALPQIRRVRIERAAPASGTETHPLQSLLLAGWLAARLDWEPGERAERTFSGAERLRLRSGSHEVVIELRSGVVPEARPGDVQRVQIEASDGDSTMTFAINREANQEHATTSVSVGSLVEGSSNMEPQQRSVRLQTPADAALLGNEIEQLDPDHVYEEAAGMAGRLAALLG